MPTIKKYKIVLIGAGNLATQLGIALTKAEHSIVQVYSKHQSSSSALAKLLKTTSTTVFGKIDRSADIYIIGVNDDSIADVAKQLRLKDKIVVHTSGSVEMKVLLGAAKNQGVFYPLQTFSKNKKADFSAVPICIEANNSQTLHILSTLAKSISNNVNTINSQERKILHLAAVFACNFSNHLYNIADNLLQKNKLSIDLLKPLIAETANKIKNESPAKMQTGPAVRGDKKTMKAHLNLLSKNKEYKQIYKILSKSISEKRKK